MSELIKSLVTDRTAYDFAHWHRLRDKGYSAMTDAERAEWDAGTLKGAYNVGDLNRVGAALNYMRDCLAEASYISPYAFTARTNWTRGDMPNAADLTHYLNCVSLIREAFSRYDATPPTPKDRGALSWQEANDIEKILVDVYTLLNNMLFARFHCGDIYSGET